ncbi:MAG: alanine--tRNA ligase, partial [Christensenellaceae bacterium]|nr:alanine--tRNA ligase [Christensenellaceae bacterium]
PKTLAVSVFEGDSDAPRDEVSARKWASLGIENDRIFYLPKKNNWWGPAGVIGPCGPDTEIFIVRDMDNCSHSCSPACNCGKYVEIWNNVFMEYNKLIDGKYVPLSQKNVDTGMGLERTVAMLNGNESVYETDVFKPAVDLLSAKFSNLTKANIRAIRVIADHMRTAVFMLGDEKAISPSNTDQGYILRRLIRRALRFARQSDIGSSVLIEVAQTFITVYSDIYTELEANKKRVITEIEKEVSKFETTLQQGLKEFTKLLNYIQNNKISGKAAFRLYDTFGFPVEMTQELAKDNGVDIDMESYANCFLEHQQKSQTGAEQKFKGGLADAGLETAKLHTATHLLLASLKKVLNDTNIRQNGSNITAERLRFDFNFPRPLTQDELSAVEKNVNTAISDGIEVVCEEMSLSDAKLAGATGVFESKYHETVKVYTIPGYSKEICGGPHAKNTKELVSFQIIKEQSSSSGIRRIKAIIKGTGQN